MKKYWQAVEAVLFLADPAQPDRKPDWHVTAALVLDPEDGETAPVVIDRKTITRADAEKMGLTLPKIADDFNAATVIEHDAVTAELAEANASHEAAVKSVKDEAAETLATVQAERDEAKFRLSVTLDALAQFGQSNVENRALLERTAKVLSPSA